MIVRLIILYGTVNHFDCTVENYGVTLDNSYGTAGHFDGISCVGIRQQITVM